MGSTLAEMNYFLILSLTVSSTLAAPNLRDPTCEECVKQMWHLGDLVKAGSEDITSYLQAVYCPTLSDPEECQETLATYYPRMLFAVVARYFLDGGLHMCQTMGVCSARRFTCDECIQGLEWVDAYLVDPIIIAEITLFLEQNFCIPDWTDCKENVATHFPPMHSLAMEKFMIPAEICGQQEACTGGTALPVV